MGTRGAAAAKPEPNPAKPQVSLLVEPTPFTHVSGYSNRFKEMLRFLKEGVPPPAIPLPHYLTLTRRPTVARRLALITIPTPILAPPLPDPAIRGVLLPARAGGDELEVITPDDSSDRPSKFLDIPITYVPGFRLILYKQVQLTVDWGLQGFNRLKQFNPDLIHAAQRRPGDVPLGSARPRLLRHRLGGV